MKSRFNSYDVVCMTAELQKLVGLRVNQIYDIDNKTYLIKLQDKDIKQTLLIESGIRFHTTSFEWPKNPSPSGFTMKLRKHLKNKRLESLKQMGTDRIIDFQFGVGDATYHLILELYDRGNLILCDREMITLNVLRPHTEGEEIRFVVREKYPEARARVNADRRSEEIIGQALSNVKSDDSLIRILVPVLDCGPTVLMHVLLKHGLNDCKVKKKVTDETVPEEDAAGKEHESENKKGKNAKKKEKKSAESSTARYFDESKDFNALVQALNEANEFMKNANRKDNEPHGFIIQKTVEKPATEEGASPEEFYYNTEFHPYLFEQYTKLFHMKYKEFPTFDAAVDEFYSTLVGQKIDLKTYQQECEALKKLTNVKKDHEKRLEELSKVQKLNKQRAELIMRNHELINSVLVTMRQAIANQMSWEDIKEFVKNAQAAGDYVAKSIKQLKLETNHVALYLSDPYADLDNNESEEERDSDDDSETLPSMVVDIDLGLSAYANATRYYDQKRSAANKETRTKESSTKALKNAERKTQEHLKEVRTISNISKARKVFWFEKFYWFISSENYLVIGGRDQQQNELIVKRYLRPNDIYVHADIQGASSIVIRNPYTGNATDPQAAIPPKTLLEAGAMAISYSVAWDAKVTTSAYWVRAEQVSKTAPTGEYLETGSFMIRGRKNFLPPCHLILGLSVMFKLSIPRHATERCVRTFDDYSQKKYELEAESVQSENLKESTHSNEEVQEAENDSDSSDSDDGPSQFPDTHVKIGSLSTQVSVESTSIDRQVSQSSIGIAGIEEEDEEEGAIIHAAPQQMPRKNRVIQKAKGKHNDGKKKQQLQKQEKTERNVEATNEKQKSGSGLKRGQKSKLKKIKEKYKDQDEEEKLMRMEILKSAGNKKQEAPKEIEQPEPVKPQRNPNSGEKKEHQPKSQTETATELDAAEEDDTQGDGNDTDMLNSLTGLPVDEDELLFALPVVAPYNALHNYKYKVKITPGTGRRGKTSKTALAMFLKEKSCSNQEKDLIKAIKPDLAARNMPGKVKLSAPQMQRLRN